jgi:hypothetical protein
VRVGNAVAEARALATDLTVGSHGVLLIISWSGFARYGRCERLPDAAPRGEIGCEPDVISGYANRSIEL